MFRLPNQAAYDLVRDEHRIHVPVTFGSDVTRVNVDFLGYGFDRPLTDTSTFRDHLDIVRRGGAVGPQLHAVYTGALNYLPPASGSVGATLILALRDPFVLQAYRHLRPDWLPAPRVAVYQNVSPARLEMDLDEMGSADPEAMGLLVDWWRAFGIPIPASERWLDCVHRFMAGGSTPIFLPVRAGWRIGQAEAVSAGWQFRFKFLEGVNESCTMNPSWCFARCAPIVHGLSGHILESELSTPTWSPASNGVFRFVRQGGASNGTFDTPAMPAGTVSAALDAAQPNDTVVILDTGIYRERLDIDKPVTITGVATTNPRDAASHDAFPKLDGGGTERVARIHWSSPDAEDGFSHVCLRQVVVRRGFNRDQVGTAHYEGGGGITIRESHRVIIEECTIVDNESRWVSPSTINLFARFTSATQMLIEGIDGELATRLRNVKNFGLGGQGFGGGISCLGSSAYILRNRISENMANCRGGAIGVASYGWPIIEGNIISENRVIHGGGEGRPDGGAIGITIAIPSEKPLSLCISDMTDDLVVWEHGLSPSERIALSGELLSGLGLISAFLGPRAGDYWSPRKLNEAKEKHVVLLDNQILDNHADDDGGGIYLSVMSAAFMRGNRLERNETRDGSGGGLRVTMASQVWSVGDQITHNRAFIGSGTNAGSGGGGIGARNSELTLVGNGVVSENVARGWAGGGIYFSSSGEGGTENLFHVILFDIFLFRQSILQITTGTRVERNETVDIAGQGHHAKGGGLYVLRWDGDSDTLRDVPQDAIPTISVEVAAGALSDNRTTLDSGAPVGANREELFLVDQSASEEHDDADYGAASGTYRYQP